MADALPDHLLPAPDEDEELAEKRRNVEALEALTRHPAWPKLADAIKAETAALQYRIITGKCKSWEQYLRDSAQIKGMLDVLELPATLRDKLPVRPDA